MSATWLAPLFLGELDPELRTRLALEPSELERQLAGALEAAQLAWPSVTFDGDRFVRHLAAVFDGEPGERDLSALHTDDLYLAGACAIGDPVAIGIFERELIAPLGAVLSSTGLDADGVDEVRQRVREMLLVGGEDGPGVATFRGQGTLRSWLRAVAVRQAMMHFRRRREPLAGDAALEHIPAVTGDAELAPWKHQYAVVFRGAFEAAIAALDQQQRTLLRQHHIDRLSIDALARLYQVHRATAARWVAGAREALLADVRTRVAASLNVSGADLASVFRLARSQLDLSIPRLLGR